MFRKTAFEIVSASEAGVILPEHLREAVNLSRWMVSKQLGHWLYSGNGRFTNSNDERDSTTLEHKEQA